MIREKGFSITELIIALGIVGFIAVIATQLIDKPKQMLNNALSGQSESVQIDFSIGGVIEDIRKSKLLHKRLVRCGGNTLAFGKTILETDFLNGTKASITTLKNKGDKIAFIASKSQEIVGFYRASNLPNIFKVQNINNYRIGDLVILSHLADRMHSSVFQISNLDRGRRTVTLTDPGTIHSDFSQCAFNPARKVSIDKLTDNMQKKLFADNEVDIFLLDRINFISYEIVDNTKKRDTLVYSLYKNIWPFKGTSNPPRGSVVVSVVNKVEISESFRPSGSKNLLKASNSGTYNAKILIDYYRDFSNDKKTKKVLKTSSTYIIGGNNRVNTVVDTLPSSPNQKNIYCSVTLMPTSSYYREAAPVLDLFRRYYKLKISFPNEGPKRSVSFSIVQEKGDIIEGSIPLNKRDVADKAACFEPTALLIPKTASSRKLSNLTLPTLSISPKETKEYVCLLPSDIRLRASFAIEVDGEFYKGNCLSNSTSVSHMDCYAKEKSGTNPKCNKALASYPEQIEMEYFFPATNDMLKKICEGFTGKAKRIKCAYAGGAPEKCLASGDQSRGILNKVFYLPVKYNGSLGNISSSFEMICN